MEHPGVEQGVALLRLFHRMEDPGVQEHALPGAQGQPGLVDVHHQRPFDPEDELELLLVGKGVGDLEVEHVGLEGQGRAGAAGEFFVDQHPVKEGMHALAIRVARRCVEVDEGLDHVIGQTLVPRPLVDVGVGESGLAKVPELSDQLLLVLAEFEIQGHAPYQTVFDL